MLSKNTKNCQPENVLAEGSTFIMMMGHFLGLLFTPILIWSFGYSCIAMNRLVTDRLAKDRLSKLSNRLRLLCTTMPWTVQPALFVLRGMCWMFYSYPATPQPDEFHAIGESEPPITNLGSPFYDITNERDEFQHILNSIEPSYNMPLGLFLGFLFIDILIWSFDYSLTMDLPSEFLNQFCTTMPRIQPVLFVLRGTCLMFCIRPKTSQPNEFQAIGDSEPPIINLGSPFYDITNEPDEFQQFLDSLDQSWNLPQVTPEDPFSQTLDLENFAIPPAPDASFASLLEGRGHFEQVEIGHKLASQLSESSEQKTPQRLAPTAGSIQHDSNGYAALFADVNHDDPDYTIQFMNPDNLLQPSMTVGSQRLTQSDLLAALPTTQAIDNSLEQTVTFSQTPTNTHQSVQPPRDFEGRMTCNHPECSGITFARRSGWKKHMDRHDRPYKCSDAECTLSNGFGTKGDLERHQRAVHKQPSKHIYYCPEPSCPRSSSLSSNEPFRRKDNLREHIKRKHKDLLSELLPSVQGASTSPATNQDILYSNSTALASSTHQAHTTLPGARRRRLLQDRTQSSENAYSANEEIHRLRAEMEEWKGKVSVMEHEQELLKHMLGE